MTPASTLPTVKDTSILSDRVFQPQGLGHDDNADWRFCEQRGIGSGDGVGGLDRMLSLELLEVGHGYGRS